MSRYRHYVREDQNDPQWNNAIRFPYDDCRSEWLQATRNPLAPDLPCIQTMNANTNILDFIDGSEQLFVELGEWPSFHDDEVVAVLLQREADIGAEGGSSLRLSIHVRRHEQIGLGTAQYHLKLCKNLLVHLVFKGIEDLVMSDFNGQNVIHSLDISVGAMSDTLEASVSIESSWGLKGSFRCKSVQVESLEKLPVPDIR